jgi:nucleoside-diphosphate-sugar epimerase
VINFSSLSVYGDLSRLSVINLGTQPSPKDLYGTTKLLSEHILENLHSSQTKVVNLRFPVVLCEGAHRAWLPTIREKILSGKQVDITNPHSLYNACTTYDSVYRFCKYLMNTTLPLNSAASLPLGSIPDISVRELVEKIARLSTKSALIREIHSDSRCVLIDSSDAISLGYIPPTTSIAIENWMGMKQ